MASLTVNQIKSLVKAGLPGMSADGRGRTT